MSARVFGIGLHKTGTTSLGVALEQLGYDVCHGARPLRHVLGNEQMMELLRHARLEPVFRIAEAFDAFEDHPWSVLYRELDQRFPGSRFILTVRDESRWLASAIRFWGATEFDLRTWIYGAGGPLGHEQRYVARFRAHNTEVRDYFRQRPEDLLMVDWETGDGWRELARFLGREAPALPFPHVRPPRRRGAW